jgi:arylsulfatase
MNQDSPNILLLMTDQQRGDCLGIENHPVVQTPYLDSLATSGVRFQNAFSACPVCIPARRTLMSGQKASSHGVFNNHHTTLDAPTIPGELSKAGYQTHLVGKLHLHPKRKLYGFQSTDWADGPGAGDDNDYQRFLKREGISSPRASEAHGMEKNGWAVRTWHLEERLHFSNWCSDQAINFLERRDSTKPFFLKVSYLHPHQPLTPPEFYYNRYMSMDLPEPYVGDWARVYNKPVRGLPVDAWRVCLDPIVMKQYRAAYYASINHVDNQIGRILPLLPKNTVILFCSDHGEMLGDHQWIRKRNAFQGSIRVPFLMKFPESMNIRQKCVRDEPVELMDIMPTLLDVAGVPSPKTVDGQSVLPLLRKNSPWRKFVHGECAGIPTLKSGMQYLTDGKQKYIWYPGLGKEQFFDLANDPQEMIDLAGKIEWTKPIAKWRAQLIRELRNRPEKFTDGKSLRRLNGPTQDFIS